MAELVISRPAAQSQRGLWILALVLFVVFPLYLDLFRLNLVGKYLTYAFVAVGLVMCWGYSGILSLGQGVFFGLGGYCMAMFLKLEASSPENTKIQSTPGIPDFMDWNQLTALPWFWEPFHYFGFTLIAVFLVPGLLAYIIGTAMFKRRVGGVYFAIITQAVAAILSILIIGQQGMTGGVNGITDLRTLHGWDIRTNGAKYLLYFLNSGLLMLALVVCRRLLSGRMGKLLVAVRDKEERVRFSGYDVSNFKIFVFCVAAMLSAVGGAMFTLQVGFMSPSFVGIVPSIEMVIFTAVGGRTSLLGAVYGTLVVNYGKTLFSESFPELWLFLMGGLFIMVVMVFPDGLAGVVERFGEPVQTWWYGTKLHAWLREIWFMRWVRDYQATGTPLIDWLQQGGKVIPEPPELDPERAVAMPDEMIDQPLLTESGGASSIATLQSRNPWMEATALPDKDLVFVQPPHEPHRA